MSLEKFYDQFPTSPRLLYRIKLEQQKDKSAEPPIFFLMESFAKAGSERVSEASRKMGLLKNEQAFEILRNEVPDGLAAIFLMYGLRGVFEATKSSFFAHDVFRNRVNQSLDNSAHPPIIKPQWFTGDSETLSTNQLLRMRGAFEKDRTGAIFFERKAELPPYIRLVFNELKILETDASKEILARYKERALILPEFDFGAWQLKPDVEFSLNNTAKAQINELLQSLNF